MRRLGFGVFAVTADSELATGLALHLAWCPEVRHFFGVPEAREAIARFRCRALALEIARLYPADTPKKVELRLINEGLMPGNEPPLLLQRMIRLGMPMLWSSKPVGRSVHVYFGRIIREHNSCRHVLNHPIWRLLDPTPLSAGLLADFAALAVEAGAPAALICRSDNQVTESEHYDWLLRVALSPRLGRPLALLSSLIELRHAEQLGDLPAYETCLRAIFDVVSTKADDIVFEAVTGAPCSGRRVGKVSPWLPEASPKGRVMHLTDYLAATFSRVVLNNLAASYPDEFEAYLRGRGLDLDGPPRFAWRGAPSLVEFVRADRMSVAYHRIMR